MREKIDCFLPCSNLESARSVVAQIKGSKTIQHICLLVNQPFGDDVGELSDCQQIVVNDLTSSNTLMAIAENAKADYERFAALLQKDAVTRQQFDNAKARYEAAKARYEQAAQQKQSTALVVSEQQQRLSQTHAGTSVAEAAVNLARLNLGYTVIIATCDGVMSRKDIHEGQLLQPGQQLASIVDDNQVWVVANYRETQMEHIAVGNKVEFTADAIPGVTYGGEVESIAGGTGSAFSQIPVDNATGNFVKVEQRVPVRIRLTADNKPEDVARLLAGLNVETEVRY